jgi:xylulokinase
VLQPKDYIALRLTGRIATDRNSSFCLAHAETGQYHPTYLAMLELEPEKMPPALPPTAVVGTVTSLAASATDLPMGTPVAIGTIDAWCDILGCGGVVSGCAVDVAGTSEVVALVSDRPVDGDGVFGQALTDGLYWIGGPMQMGGAALEWLADGFYGGPAAIPQLEAEAATVPPGAEGLLFLPYLRGERAPVWDDAARGAFVGLTDRHSRAHFARAVYEGVAFAVWDLLQRCLAATGTHPAVLRVSGGGARSALWNQIKADVTALPVQPMAVLDGACLGAAMLAAVAVGAFPGLADAAAAMAHPAAAFAPRAEPVARYQSLFPLWRALYPRLRPTFAGISQAGAGPPRIHGQPSTGPQGRARSGGR